MSDWKLTVDFGPYLWIWVIVAAIIGATYGHWLDVQRGYLP